jgi:hypothetical protein
MKNALASLTLLGVSVAITSLAQADVPRRLLDAIRIVESGGNDNAVGDGGNAIGPYQIWKNYWKDAVEHEPSIGGKYEDCFDQKYAEKIVNAYMDRYAIPRRLGHEPTFEDIARIHNGGPNGHKKKATIPYWDKVQSKLK